MQAQPVSRLLADFRDLIRQVAGPDGAEASIKHINNRLKEMLGEQGFEGLDINRPLGGYIVFRDAFKDTTAVIIVPVTGEKEFVGLLERMKLKVEPVKDKKGVYTLDLGDGVAAAILPKGLSLQFAGPWAYVTINGEAADPKDLLAPADLFNNAEQSLFLAKLYPERVPEKLLKAVLGELDTTAAGIKGFIAGGAPPHIGKMITTFFEDGPKLVRRYAETGHKEAAELAPAPRLGLDERRGDRGADRDAEGWHVSGQGPRGPCRLLEPLRRARAGGCRDRGGRQSAALCSGGPQDRRGPARSRAE